jgi:hypothetical protein
LQNATRDRGKTVQASAALQALEETCTQFQQISLQVDLPDELPELHADPDAIQHPGTCCKNAGAATG